MTGHHGLCPMGDRRMRILIYRTADRAPWPRLAWNDYDYRPEGGSLYRIGVALHIGRRCLSVVWGKPGTDFGHV